jgi:hypothetical protein
MAQVNSWSASECLSIPKQSIPVRKITPEGKKLEKVNMMTEEGGDCGHKIVKK